MAIGIVGCAPNAATTSPGAGQSQAPAAKKILVIADSYEPPAITQTFINNAPSSAGNNIMRIVHEGLVYTPEFQVNEPGLASELPSIDRGTWRINADGTMETTWHLRPNAKWHDGHQFTSDDLAFTYKAGRDPEIAGTGVSASDRLIDSVSAPDPLTFVMHWNAPFVDAAITGVGPILPKHLAEDLYLKDKLTLPGNPVFASGFVGLGPYRLAQWERGSHFETVRFDEYYRGRPALDGITVRFVSDPNVLVVQVLSGFADAAISSSSSGVSLDQALEAKKRWEGTSNQVLLTRSGLAVWAEAQYRAEYARPVGTMDSLQVRRALLQSINLPALNDVMTFGLAPQVDSYFLPDEPARPTVESHIVKYPYDPARAAQLFNEAGWSRGTDGILTRQTDGQKLALDFWVRAGSGEKVASIVADDWTRAGVAANPYVIPAALRTDREYEAKRSGFLCCVRVGLSSFYGGKLHQRQINSEATRWQGINYGGYTNPRADSLLDQINSTMDPKARLPLEQQLVNLYTSEVAILPMWWEIWPQLLVQGVKGPRVNAAAPTGNIFEWTKE